MLATAFLLLVPVSAPIDPAPGGGTRQEKALDDAAVAALVADLASEDSTKQRRAYEALLMAGPKAKAGVPALVKSLGTKGVPTGYVAEILGAIGPDAKEAVPALLAQLPKEEGHFGYGVETLARALAKIDGPKNEATRSLLLSTGKGIPIFLTASSMLLDYPAEIVKHLIVLCGDKSAKVREHAALVIAGLKEKPVQKVPAKSTFEKAGDAVKGIPAALEKMLGDDAHEVRLAAARAITHVAPEHTDKALAATIALAVETVGKSKSEPSGYEVFKPVPEKAMKVLIPLLDSPNESLRWWAINHAAYLDAREVIEDALKSGKTALIRQGAAQALGARYGTGSASAPALVTALKDNVFGVRFAAAQALVHVAAVGSESYAASVPILVEGLQQKEENVRVTASQHLLMTGAAAKSALPTLKKLLNDDKATVRLEAALALVGIDVKEASGTVSALVEGLKMGDGPATRAAKALAALGPVAKDAVPELVKHFDAKHVHLKLNAAAAVALIDSAQAEKATAVLAALLQNEKYKSSMVRSYSLVALKRIGAPAKFALPTLEKLLADDGPFHTDVALAMIAIDPEGAKPAFEWIRKVLGKPGNEDSYELAEQLPNLGAKGKPLVPDMIALLKSKTTYFRESAIAVLAAVGTDAREALPELKKVAESDPRTKTRKLAADAIKRIEGM